MTPVQLRVATVMFIISGLIIAAGLVLTYPKFKAQQARISWSAPQGALFFLRYT